jgi:hypothetical protein
MFVAVGSGYYNANIIVVLLLNYNNFLKIFTPNSLARNLIFNNSEFCKEGDYKV